MLPLMHMLLPFLISCALSAMCTAQECGREMLSYNFNDHTGPFKNWTTDAIWSVWPQTAARDDFRGDSKFPGLIYTKGLERASVGYQQLRLLMPKVCSQNPFLLPLLIRLIFTAYRTTKLQTVRRSPLPFQSSHLDT